MSSAQRVGMKSRNDQFVVVINNGNRNDQPDAEYGNHCFAACLSGICISTDFFEFLCEYVARVGIMFPPLGFILALATDNKKHRLAFLNGGIATICFLSFAATLVGVFVPMSNNCDTTNDCKATAWLDSQSNNRLDHLTGCAFPAVVAAAASYLKSRGYTSNMSSNPCSSCDSCYASYNKWYLALYIGAPFLLISFCTLVVVGIIASRKYSNKSVTTLQVSDQNVPGQMITKTDTNQQPADAIMRSDMYSEDNRSTYRAEPTKINDIVTSYPPSYLMSSKSNTVFNLLN